MIITKSLNSRLRIVVIIFFQLLSSEVMACVSSLITGSVIDQCTGEGIGSAIVTTENGQGCGAGNQTLTFKDGQFSFSLVPGIYTFSASKIGYIEQSRSVKVFDAEQTEVNFSLTPENGCSVVAKPVDPDQAVAVYDETSGKLSIKDIRIGSEQPVTAELQNLGEYRFKLMQVTYLPAPISPSPAFYNFDTGLLEISRLYSFKQMFSIRMKYVGNNIYVLSGSPVKVILE